MLEKSDLQAIRELMNESIETALQPIKEDIAVMKEDIAMLKESAYILENDVAPKVQLLLENHSDLAKNANAAKNIEERVSFLEFENKLIRKLLDARLNNSELKRIMNR